MKILFISTMQSYPWGGSEELWTRVANKALEKKHSVQVCVKEWQDEHPRITSLRQKGAWITKRKERIYTLATRIRFRLLKTRKQERHFKDIASFNPDCILLSQGGTFDFMYHKELLAFIQALDKPYFIISQFNTENGNILPPDITESIQQLHRRWTRFYFVSERNLKAAERQAAMKLNHARVIDNPVNVTVVQKLEWPHSESLQLACVARYDCRHKGQDILMETLSLPEFKDVNYRLNLYGAGPDRQHLARLIIFFNLADKVIMHDHVADIDNIWQKNHVLVLPSIAEGTPLALQECMLKGRPALVTDVGGCSQLVKDGETGFLCPVASVASLRVKLRELFDTPDGKLKQMGDNAFELANRVIDLNSPGIILEELEQSVVNAASAVQELH